MILLATDVGLCIDMLLGKTLPSHVCIVPGIANTAEKKNIMSRSARLAIFNRNGLQRRRLRNRNRTGTH